MPTLYTPWTFSSWSTEMTMMPLLNASSRVAFKPLTSPGLTRMASTFLAIRFWSCWICPGTSVSALSMTRSLVMPCAIYSALTALSSSIIWVRYSLLMKEFEMPMVNFLAGAAVAGAAVAGAAVAGATVAGAAVAGAGAWVGAAVGVPQAASMDVTAIRI